MGCASTQLVKPPAEVIVSDTTQEYNANPSPASCDADEVKFHEDYMLGTKLGRGAFAQVRSANRRKPGLEQNNQGVAVKIINMHDESDMSVDGCSLRMQKSIREASIWKKVAEHPNCVGLHGLFSGNNFCYMVMEKCDQGLFQALETMPILTERGLGKVISGMLLGVDHCHSVNVLHRDIKPDNFLVGAGGVVKLADFGFSTLVSSQGKVAGIYGTAPFMCPEMLSGEEYDEKADVWSLAVCVYAFLFGSFPYTPTKDVTKSMSASRAMKRAIRLGAPPTFEASRRVGSSVDGQFRSEEATQLAKALLDRDAVTRPSAGEALRMPWIVASMLGDHLPHADLPSLRPMIHMAKKAGAFEVRDNRKVTGDDVLLNQLQMQQHVNRTVNFDIDDMPVESAVPVLRSGRSQPKGASDTPEMHSARKEWETASNRSTQSGSSSRIGSSSSEQGVERWRTSIKSGGDTVSVVSGRSSNR